MTIHPIPIEEVAKFPLPGMSVPGGVPVIGRNRPSIEFTPDDRQITYLFSPEGTLINQLYIYNLQTGEQYLMATPPQGGTTETNVSPEEALRRERMRLLSQGIPQYSWARQGNRILVPVKGDVYVIDWPGSGLRKVVDAQGKPAIDPQISPDGEWIAYVQDAEVYVVPCAPGKEGIATQITHGARGTGKTNGLAEFVAQEEMHRRHGFWWSPDSQRIAFAEVDETHIPVYRIMHQGKDFTGEIAQEDHHYPFTGAENARVRLGVVSRDGGEPMWMDLRNASEERYLARVNWLPDGTLTAQLENREQTMLELVRFDLKTGLNQVVLTEENPVWINLNDFFTPLKDGTFIWGSERSGFMHLYLYDREGQLLRALTQGEWVVDEICGVDLQRRRLYFTSSQASPLESNLYVASLDGGEPQRITMEPGVHAVKLDHACRRFTDTYHSTTHAPTVTYRSIEDGDIIRTIYDRPDARVEQLTMQTPEVISMQNREGVRLYGAIYRPPEGFGTGPFPTIVFVYGGPHVQMVRNCWFLTVQMRMQYLAQQGYLGFILDNRGSARRGQVFEAAIRHDFGHHEVEDQVDGVHWLVQQGLADPDRIGIVGWSYGGYMASMSLVRAPEIFKAAVAGAPVTNQDGYDTHYTERYMGTPQTNPEGYQSSSVMTYVDQMRGHLLIVHGLIDENVHFRHTARLINALIRAQKPYELLLLPDERHSPRRLEDRVYMEERIVDFLKRHLG